MILVGLASRSCQTLFCSSGLQPVSSVFLSYHSSSNLRHQPANSVFLSHYSSSSLQHQASLEGLLVPADRTRVRWPARNIDSVDAAGRAMVTACLVSAHSIEKVTSISHLCPQSAPFASSTTSLERGHLQL